MTSQAKKVLFRISTPIPPRCFPRFHLATVQKMAPGDRSFHMVSWDDSKKFNPMKTFPSRAEADKAYSELKGVPKILVSGETGDVVLSEGK